MGQRTGSRQEGIDFITAQAIKRAKMSRNTNPATIAVPTGPKYATRPEYTLWGMSILFQVLLRNWAFG
jgi:hypothetical protein